MRADACRDCVKNCASCVKEGKHNFPQPYPLDLRMGEKVVPNTFDRFVEDQEADIEAYVCDNYSEEDWDKQFSWLFNNPQVAFNMLNGYSLPNEVKVAKVVKRLTSVPFGVTIILGIPGGGKTWSWLWAAEAMHDLEPDKHIYYCGKNLKVPKWVELLEDLTEAKNNCWVGVDEAAIRAPARRAMSNINVWLSSESAICRHKKRHLFLLSQHPEMIDKNQRRLALAYILKPVLLEPKGPEDVYTKVRPYVPDAGKWTGTRWEGADKTGFYDMNTKEAFLFWQPRPKSAERYDFTEAFKDYDVTAGETLFGKPTASIKPPQRLLTCVLCGHIWHPRGKLDPAKCPKCHKTGWNVYNGARPVAAVK